LDAKQTKLEEDYKNIDKLVKDAEDKNKKILSDARKKGNTIVEEAKALGEKSRNTIVADAEKEAKEMFQKIS